MWNITYTLGEMTSAIIYDYAYDSYVLENGKSVKIMDGTITCSIN